MNSVVRIHDVYRWAINAIQFAIVHKLAKMNWIVTNIIRRLMVWPIPAYIFHLIPIQITNASIRINFIISYSFYFALEKRIILYNNVFFIRIGVNYCSPTKTISCSLSDNGKYIDRCLNNEYVCNGFNDCPKLFDDEYGCPYGGELHILYLFLDGIANYLASHSIIRLGLVKKFTANNSMCDLIHNL